jgi:hypothetical protein
MADENATTATTETAEQTASTATAPQQTEQPQATQTATTEPPQTEPQQSTEQATTPEQAPPQQQQTPPGPPEKYELAIPATPGNSIDQADVDAVIAKAKAKGWTNEQAQAELNEVAQEMTALRTAIESELDAHAEVGGVHKQAAQEYARKALDKFLPANSPERVAFDALLNKTGYGSYAPVVLLSRAGKSMSEDRPLGGGHTGRETAQTADARLSRMFPSMAGSGS